MLVVFESMEDVKEDVLEPEIEIEEILGEVSCFFWSKEFRLELLKIINYVRDPCNDKYEQFEKFY